MKKTNPLFIILLLALMLYHGCVIKAERTKEAKQCDQYRSVSQAEYKKCKENITYFSTFFDFKEIFHAWD